MASPPDQHIYSTTFVVYFPFECPNCDKRFRSQNDLEAHIVRRSCDITVICDVCDQLFSGYLDLTEHQRAPCQPTHRDHQRVQWITSATGNSKLITCIRCKIKFPSISELKRHTKCFHPKPEDPSVYHKPSISLLVLSNYFICVRCDKNFASVRSLREHIKHNICADPAQCPKCGKHYQRLILHEKHCQSTECNHCGQIFKSSFYLRNHISVHTTKNENYLCDRCGIIYEHLVMLREHMRIDHNIKWNDVNDEMRCSLCKSVTTKRKLFRHAVSCHEKLCRGNLAVGPYDPVSCHNCQMTLPAAIDYASHVHLCLPNPNNIDYHERCYKCPYTTAGPQQLQLHLVSHMTVDDFSNLDDEALKSLDKTHEGAQYTSSPPTKKQRQMSDTKSLTKPSGMHHDPLSSRSLYSNYRQLFQCVHCDYTTHDNDDLANHVSWIHGNNIELPQPKIIAVTGSTRDPEQPTINKDKAYSCFVCLRQFHSEEYVQIHLKLCERRHKLK